MTDPPDTERRLRDGELLERHLRGDAAAFAALVRRYEHELFNFLYRLTGDATIAEDAFQETFLQVHLSAGAFDTARPLKPWLFTIAANKARDVLRTRRRRQAAPLDAAVGNDRQGASHADLMAADVPAPDQVVMNLETRQAVDNAVMRLPENLRTVLLLCYFQELPYKDVAEILGVPLGTVKSRLHAAVQKFAEQWRSIAKGSDDHERRKA